MSARRRCILHGRNRQTIRTARGARASASCPPSPISAQTFRKLHESGCFVIPNPWNVGTARYLQHLGFKALATTSSGFAHAQGLRDGAVPRDMMLAASARDRRSDRSCRSMPISKAAMRDAPDGVAESVRLCVATGVAGLSIEDFDRRCRKPALRFRPRFGARARRACGDRQGRRRRRLHRPHRRLRARPARSRRDYPPAQGLCRGRRRLPLFAGIKTREQMWPR